MGNELNLNTIISNSKSLAILDLEGLSYRPDNIKVRQEIVLPNLAKNTVTTIDLKDSLKFPLLVTDIRFNNFQTDANGYYSPGVINGSYSDYAIKIAAYNRQTNELTYRKEMTIGSNFQLPNELILDPAKYIYKVIVPEDMVNFTFVGEPVFMRDPIVFVDKVENQ